MWIFWLVLIVLYLPSGSPPFNFGGSYAFEVYKCEIKIKLKNGVSWKHFFLNMI
jgi:hypothetical protein